MVMGISCKVIWINAASLAKGVRQRFGQDLGTNRTIQIHCCNCGNNGWIGPENPLEPKRWFGVPCGIALLGGQGPYTAH